MLFDGAILLSAKPLTLLAFESGLDVIHRHAHAAGVRPKVFTFVMWYKARWLRAARMLAKTRRLQPLDVTLLCPTAAEVRRLRLMRTQAVQCHQNLLCSEQTFHIDHAAAPRWDALYNAAILPFKRHTLASDVRRLKIVSRTPWTANDLAQIGLSHADVSAGITREEVCTIINSSACGLALSAEEGGMLAATEYLLCGVPIVSTPSRGGREFWYTAYNHLIAAPHPESVREGVEHFLRFPPRREVVRNDALRLIWEQRHLLAAIVNGHCQYNAVDPRSLFSSEREFLCRQIRPGRLAEAFDLINRGATEAAAVCGHALEGTVA